MRRLEYNYRIIRDKGARKLKESKRVVAIAYRLLKPHLTLHITNNYPKENKDETPAQRRRKWGRFAHAIHMELKDRF